MKEESPLLLAYRGDQNNKANTWCLDTSASNRMSSDSNIFLKLDEWVSGSVKFGDSYQRKKHISYPFKK